MRQAFVALLLLAALMAGCADPNDSGSTDDSQFEDAEAFDDVEVTDTTGAIRGVVVNEAVVPLQGALVQIANGPNRTTDKDGAFVFNNLEPGEYFLEANLTGYKTIQSSATVVAGDREPPITKIVLLMDASAQPYATVQQWTGFLQCGVWAFVVTTNPCAFTGSDNVHGFPFDAGRVPTYAQGEAIWDGTQPLGNWLDFSINDPNGVASSCYGVNSLSPALLAINETQVKSCYGDEPTELVYKIFPGASEDTPPVPTILTNQQYDIYVQYFYGFVPGEGYSLAEEGVCTSPAQCG